MMHTRTLKNYGDFSRGVAQLHTVNRAVGKLFHVIVKFDFASSFGSAVENK